MTTIAAIAKQGGLFIEVGGGIRDEARIEQYLSLGVGRCILGTIAVKDFDFTARMAQKYGPEIAVGVDMRDGLAITASGGIARMEELAELQAMGCHAAILGKSIYTGAIDLKQAVALYQE